VCREAAGGRVESSLRSGEGETVSGREVSRSDRGIVDTEV